VSQKELNCLLDILDGEFGGQLHFRCVGPLPPYSFATVEAQVPSFDDLDKARRFLNLAEKATYKEIKHAYHQMAGQLHPDHNIEGPKAQKLMAELTTAYRMLTTYAESRALSTQEGPGNEDSGERYISFDPEEGERTVLIAVRRQEVPIDDVYV
jgi:hypothetical protein